MSQGERHFLPACPKGFQRSARGSDPGSFQIAASSLVLRGQPTPVFLPEDPVDRGAWPGSHRVRYDQRGLAQRHLFRCCWPCFLFAKFANSKHILGALSPRAGETAWALAWLWLSPKWRVNPTLGWQQPGCSPGGSSQGITAPTPVSSGWLSCSSSQTRRLWA